MLVDLPLERLMVLTVSLSLWPTWRMALTSVTRSLKLLVESSTSSTLALSCLYIDTTRCVRS